MISYVIPAVEPESIVQQVPAVIPAPEPESIVQQALNFLLAWRSVDSGSSPE